MLISNLATNTWRTVEEWAFIFQGWGGLFSVLGVIKVIIVIGEAYV